MKLSEIFAHPLIKMYNFSKMNLSCWTLVAFILLPKFELGETFRQLLQHRLAKREEPCTQYQFLCKSDNKCIDRFLICDGVKDCADGSDETAELCSDINCPRYSFRCKYGACVDATAKCNGHMDCADNSDETDVECDQSEAAPLQNCSPNHFKCNSGQCIDKTSVCNGKRDCLNGDDETTSQCENNPPCSHTSFRCEYGACIEGKFRCDGIKHCADGSDEKCPGPTPSPTTSTTTESSAPGFCNLPHKSLDKDFKVEECPDGKKCNEEHGKRVPQLTKVSFKCNDMYEYDERQNNASVCINGKWFPPIENCNRVCNRIFPKNVDLTCFRKGKEIDCTNLLAGAIVRPRCKPQHQKEYPVGYEVITCQEDGKWSNQLFTCIPDKVQETTGNTVNIFINKPLIVLSPEEAKKLYNNPI